MFSQMPELAREFASKTDFSKLPEKAKKKKKKDKSKCDDDKIEKILALASVYYDIAVKS
jgi:hypothetical protein